MNSFSELNLPLPISKALTAMEFTTPTPIQAAAIPIAITGRDLIACAQTGTGKTATFCIPMLMRLLKNPNKTALILAPTRELAAQIDETWREISKYSPDMRSVILIGGVAMAPQIRGLRANARVVIATPGRLMDHLNRGSLKLDSIDVLVLDEADRMLDMGFAPQLNQIMRYVPKQRQTLLFSATWAKEMDQLASKYLTNPERVTVGNMSRAAPKIAQFAVQTSQQGKNDMLLDELNAREGSVLVFARTQSRTDRVAKYLNSFGMLVGRIHGGRTQAQRTAALAAFKGGGMRVLIATDIAARGIDVSNIMHVINFDLPQVPEDYIHRIGRTARAEKTGEALSFISPEERAQWRDIVALLKKTGSLLPEMKGGPSTPAVSLESSIAGAGPSARPYTGRGRNDGRAGGSRGGNNNARPPRSEGARPAFIAKAKPQGKPQTKSAAPSNMHKIVLGSRA